MNNEWHRHLRTIYVADSNCLWIVDHKGCQEIDNYLFSEHKNDIFADFMFLLYFRVWRLFVWFYTWNSQLLNIVNIKSRPNPPQKVSDNENKPKNVVFI